MVLNVPFNFLKTFMQNLESHFTYDFKEKNGAATKENGAKIALADLDSSSYKPFSLNQ